MMRRRGSIRNQRRLQKPRRTSRMGKYLFRNQRKRTIKTLSKWNSIMNHNSKDSITEDTATMEATFLSTLLTSL
jgi:hypothetical protein